MFKLLRKYNKIILAVGGSLLMIVFLVPQAIQGLSQRAARAGAEVATVGLDSEEVSLDRWAQVQEEVQVIEKLGIQVQPLDNIKDPAHWFLLTREAEQAGLIGPQPSGQHGVTEETLRQLRMATGLSSDAIVRTLANADGVQRMLSLYIQAGELSDKRLTQYLKRLFHGVGIETVAITADPDDSELVPTEAQITAQFDKYKNDLPGEGDRGYGYKIPDRVKLEWLTIPAEDVRATIESTDEMSNRELRRHWRENENQRGIPPVGDGAEVPEIVREDLLTKLTTAKLDQIEKFAYDQIRIPQRSLERASGFFVLPADWDSKKLKFGELADRIQERFGVRPQYHSAGADWVNVDKVLEIEGIGESATDRFAGAASTLADFVLLCKELGGDGGIPIQKNVAGPPLKGADNSRYLFRIADVDPSHSPKSVDEVRDQVVTDLKREAAYEALKSQMATIEQTAVNDGLLSLAMQYDTEVAADMHLALYDPDKYYIDNIMQRGMEAMPSQVPGVGEAEELVEEIIDWAMSLPSDKKVTELTEAQRTKVFAVDDKFIVLAVRITKQLPLTEEDYRQLMARNRPEGLLLNEELDGIENVRSAFSMETLSQRHHFQMKTRNVDEDGNEITDETKTVAEAGT